MVDTDQLLKKLQENNLTHWKKVPDIIDFMDSDSEF